MRESAHKGRGKTDSIERVGKYNMKESSYKNYDELPLFLNAVTENRISRLLFKLAVEQDMVMNVLAAGMEIPDEQLKALPGRCVQDVKKTSGSISLDDAVCYQRGGL